MFKFPSVLRADRNARYAAVASLSPSKPFRPQNPDDIGKSRSTSSETRNNGEGYVKEQI